MRHRHLALLGLLVLATVGAVLWRRGPLATSAPADSTTPSTPAATAGAASRSRRAGPTERRRIGGRVTFAGKPVASATVALTRTGSRIAAARVTTAADGRFDLGPHPVGPYLVVAEAADHAAAHALVDLDDPDGRPDPGALELALGACTVRVSGVVSDAGGGVVADARVTFLIANAGAGVTVTTNESGAYRLCAPASIGSGHLRAEAEGYGTVGLPLVGPLPHAITRDLRLSPEAVVAGRVIDPGGAPVAGVTVEVGWNTLSTATTDDGGAFRVSGVAGGRHPVRVEGYLVEPAQEVAVTPGQSIDGVVITVRLMATLAGVVRRGGLPVAGARVATGPGLGAERAYSDAQGRFVIEALRPGTTVTLEVEGEALLAPVRVELDRLAVEGVVLELVPTRTLRGEVRRGGAGARARVTAIGAVTTAVDTDEAGRFSLALPPGSYHLSAWRDGASSTSAPVEVPFDADPAPLVIELAATGTLAGTLVDERGAPVQGIHLEARHGDSSCVATTAADGAFSIVDLPTGVPLSLSAEAPGLGLEVAIVRVEPTGAPILEAADPHATGLRVVARWSGRTISGRIETTAGAPLPDAHVMMGRGYHGEPQESPLAPSAISGMDGRFVLAGVPPGTHTLIIRSPDGERVIRAGVEAGAQGVVVAFARRGAIVGELVGFSAPPAELGAVRSCEPAHERGEPGCGESFAGTMVGSRFRIDAVPPGRYAVRAVGADERAGTAIEVREGQTVEVRLESSGTAGLRVRTVDWKTGQPLGAVPCQLIRERGRGELTTDASGVAELDRAPAGPATVVCGGRDGFSDGRADVELPAGGRADVEIALLVRSTAERASIGASFGGSPGLRVSEVEPDGPAHRGGLAVGDTVIAIDGRSIERLHHNAAYAFILERPAGSRVRLTVRRDGQERTLEIVLA